jgi:hypothetical protein
MYPPCTDFQERIEYWIDAGGIMDKDDEAARKARAERLRQQVSDLLNKSDAAPGRDETGASQETSESSQEPSSSKESPREFIHRKMRELDKKEG